MPLNLITYFCICNNSENSPYIEKLQDVLQRLSKISLVDRHIQKAEQILKHANKLKYRHFTKHFLVEKMMN